MSLGSIRSSFCHPALRRVTALAPLLLWLFLLLPTGARANCTTDLFSPATASVVFSFPSQITIPFTLVVNGALGSPVTASPANPVSASCTNGTVYGVQNMFSAVAPTVVGGNYIYPTSIPGVGIELTHNSGSSAYSMAPYPGSTTSGGDSTYSVSTTVQLVQTGPIANGSVLPSGEFAYWQWGNIVPEYFTLNNAITFVAPACNVDTSSITVALPTLATSDFPNKDTTAGTTPFAIQLTCPSGSTANASIKFTASNGYPTGYSTQLLKNTGTATGLGVELLDQNSTPVVFGSVTAVGTTPSGAWSLPYFARYHSISNAVGAGTVKAVATFTITYQ